MNWLIDTNIISFAMKGRDGLAERIRKEPVDRLMTSAVVIAEGLTGLSRLPPAHPFRAGWQVISEDWTILDFDLPCAQRYAHLRADLQHRGCMIGIHDCMIAATALAWQDAHPGEPLTLVSDNLDEFRRVPGLRVVSWMRG